MTAVKTLSGQHSISILCRVLHVNRSSYYKFLHKSASAREHENTQIRTRILEIYAKSDKRLGVHKIAICLKRDYCINISDGRVSRLMKTMNLPKMSTAKPPRFKAAKEETYPHENLLKQRFDQPAPNMVWVSDFTYIRVANRFYYVCVILDLFSRKVIAYRISSKIDRFLAITTLDDAVASRGVTSGLMFHSDQGSQFTSADFRKEIDKFNIVQSFSKKGHPYDNAVMECFFKYLKKEETDRRCFRSLQELQLSLFQYINGFYNSVRPHSHNGGLSPIQRESLFL
jgi:transposase InsO family protein